MRIMFISDTHYGLKSGGVDRTDEIHEIVMKSVDYAIEHEVDLYVHGGDIGHHANPTSRVHGLLIEVFTALNTAGIESRFMAGNHDVVHSGGGCVSSLEPLVSLGYEHVSAIVRPTCEVFDNNGIRFGVVFLPFVSRSSIGGNSVDGFLDDFVTENINFIEDLDTCIAFTHLNPVGAKSAGDYALRPVEAVVPAGLFAIDNMAGVFSGHIHHPQIIRQVSPCHWIVGAPIVTDFGDSNDKRILVVDMCADGIAKVDSIPTDAVKMVDLNYDFVDGGRVEYGFDPADVVNAGVRVNIMALDGQVNKDDIEQLRADLLGAGARFVRKIVPSVVRCESGELSIVREGSSDADLIRTWIETKKPPAAASILSKALATIEQIG